MNPPNAPAADDARRAAVRRTVGILVVCALAAYGLFFFLVTRGP